MLARLATLLVAGVLTLSPARAETLTVLAAASTVEAIEEALGRFRASHDQDIQASYAASSALARQIEYGAPADIFISANPRWMDYLAERGHVEAGLRRDLLTNELALIAPADTTLAPAMLSALGEQLGAGRLAIGDPDHVPGGMYARQALETLGLWEAVRDRLAPAANVRAALMLVARGEARLGIVYRTDATAAAGVLILDAVPAASHTPIVYPIAVVSGHGGESVRTLFDFLISAEAAEVFRRHGFGIP